MVGLTACSGGPDLDAPGALTPEPAATNRTSAAPSTVTPTAERPMVIPPQLDGFQTTTIRIAGNSFLVAVASSEAERRQGLMEIEDLGDLDGMLFSHESEVTSSVVMRNTLIPLDIAFFDRNGALIEILSMVPCESEPCPTYHAGAPFRWAVETPAGGLQHLRPGAQLEV